VTRRGARKGLAVGSRPRLDPDIIVNHEMLGAVLGDVADADAQYRAASTRIVQLQKGLRTLVGKDAWAVYLALEVATNDRNADLHETLARWAFTEGQKHLATAPGPTPADLPDEPRPV
jgi:hypothetical protein